MDSGSTSKHFEVRINSSAYVQLRFGNGIFGEIPENDLTIIYKIGGGEIGNVDANTITEVLSNVVDVADNPVTLTVTNATAVTGGADLLSVDSARRLIPLAGRSQQRTVSNQDYENNCLLISGIARSLALSPDIDPTIPERYQDVIIVPNGGGIPSAPLITEVKTYFSNTGTRPKMSGINLRVFGATYKLINIQLTAYRLAGSTTEQLKETMTDDLEEYFELVSADKTVNTKIDFGGRHINSTGDIDSVLPYSDLYKTAVSNIHTRKLGLFLLNDDSIDISLLLREFPVIGVISIIDGDTGAIL